MADEAFALSPISARAALPGEEDYAAISEAFMETSRGRWFLTEYAKRNRNADTRMVLDAVARIEQSLVAQKEETLAAQRDNLAAQQESLAAQQESLAAQKESLAAQQHAAAAEAANLAAAAATAAADAANTKLAEALAAIRGAVETAQASATEALDGLALEQTQIAVRKGSRVLREIAWRLREIGNDSRICDLIDSQVAVIEQAAEPIGSETAKAALGAAFATIEGRLAEFSHDDRTPAPAAEAAPALPAPAPPEMPVAAMAETAEVATVQEAPEVAAVALAEAALAEADAALAQAEALELADVADILAIDTEVTDEADAHDEAILDIIAMEMGAPDPIDDDEIVAAVAEQAHVTELPPNDVVARVPEPVAAAIAQPVAMPPQPVLEAAPATPSPAPAMEISLGSSILASGMLSKPAKAANDPLAPIRRMSQVEKIAFFS
ncbi:MAG: hypothetical protein ABJA75_14735 [Bradyrhizobium sp.]